MSSKVADAVRQLEGPLSVILREALPTLRGYHVTELEQAMRDGSGTLRYVVNVARASVSVSVRIDGEDGGEVPLYRHGPADEPAPTI